jgi:hypothetical protein
MAIHAAALMICNAVYEDPSSHNVTLLGIFTALQVTRFPTPYRDISAYAILVGMPGETGELKLSCVSAGTGEECAQERQRVQIGEFGKRQVHIRLAEIRFPGPDDYLFSLAFEGVVIAEQEIAVRLRR